MFLSDDHSRVVLKDAEIDDNDDYINASYIHVSIVLCILVTLARRTSVNVSFRRV